MSNHHPTQPCLFIIFGMTGDLSKRKLLPALARLAERGMLDGTHILGVARSTEMNEDQLRQMARSVVGESVQGWCDRCIHYRTMDDKLAAQVQELEQKHKLSGNRVFYLALPPQAFSPTIELIGK